LQKNNSRLVAELESVIVESTNSLVKSFVTAEEKAKIDRGVNSFNSVGKKYTNDLNRLLSTLGRCSLQYVRCFRPNREQRAHYFHGSVVLEQMKESGTIELVEIMHEG
jgi:myosin heavy subunit